MVLGCLGKVGCFSSNFLEIYTIQCLNLGSFIPDENLIVILILIAIANFVKKHLERERKAQTCTTRKCEHPEVNNGGPANFLGQPVDYKPHQP